MDDADVEAFLNVGYTKQQVLEVILGVAQKVLSNDNSLLRQVSRSRLATKLQAFSLNWDGPYNLADTPVGKPMQAFAWTKAQKPTA